MVLFLLMFFCFYLFNIVNYCKSFSFIFLFSFFFLLFFKSHTFL